MFCRLGAHAGSFIGADSEWDSPRVRCAQVCVPPTAAHCHQQLDCVLVTLGLCPDMAKPRLLVLALRIQQVEKSGAAPGVADALQTHGFRCHIERVLLCSQKIRIVGQGLQDIGDLPERQ